MTPAKYQAALDGQSAIARKVLDMVPIQSAWTRAEIASNLKRVTKSTPDVAVLDGCLARLKAAGLVRERSQGKFQRVEVREREVEQVSKVEATTAIVPETGSTKSPIEILSSLAVRARELATAVVVLASDIETAALTIDQGMAETNNDLEILRQFKAMLVGDKARAA